MSSGAKRRCALGVHCVIAALRAHDHTCDDWTEIQESDYTQRLTNLLLKAEGAAGETLHLAEDVRVELDYLAALDDGRYRCVVMLVPVLSVLSYIPYIHVFFFRSLAGPAPQNGRIRTPAKKTANSRTLPASSSLLEAQTSARRAFTRKRGITGLGRKNLRARVLGQPKRRLVSPRLPPPQRRGTTEAA